MNISQTLHPNVAIITGAAGSFGSALAVECARGGWETVLLDKNRRGLEKLYDQLTQEGYVEPSIHVMDLETVGPQQCTEMVAALERAPGRLDAVIHCAASFEGLQPLDHISPQEWLRSIQVNLNAPWLLSVACLPLLRQSREASLYFVGEDLEKVKGAFWGAYGVSKHGVCALAAEFAAELSNTNIQVLVLNPGPMRSALRARVYHSENPLSPDGPNASAKKTLEFMRRKVTPADLFVELEGIHLHK